MRDFTYPCPNCGSTSELHPDTCNYYNEDEIGENDEMGRKIDFSRTEIEQAYVDIITALSFRDFVGGDLVDKLDHIDSKLLSDCLHYLVTQNRVFDLTDTELMSELESIDPETVPDDANVYYHLPTHAEWKTAVSYPSFEPLKTIYEEGSYPGCHDNAVFALVAYFQMVGLTWDETVDMVEEWFDETGTWERGGFEEDTPRELIEDKKHVYDNEYGWSEKGEAAKNVIESRM